MVVYAWKSTWFKHLYLHEKDAERELSNKAEIDLFFVFYLYLGTLGQLEKHQLIILFLGGRLRDLLIEHVFFFSFLKFSPGFFWAAVFSKSVREFISQDSS